MWVRFLGTSAAMPSAARSHVSFVLRTAGQMFLVECGPTVPWQLERAGLDHRRISDVLVSHVHGDHSLGLPMFLTLGELDGRDWPLRVYCPASAVAGIQAACRAVYPSLEAVVEQQVEWISLPEDTVARRQLIGGVELATAPGRHGVPDVAVRFDFGGRSLVYSGDTAPAPAIRHLARGTDLLLHEATWSESIDGRTSADHSSCRQAGRLAHEAGAIRLGLVHLHKSYYGQEDALRREAAEQFSGEILIPNDGDEVDL